VTTRAVMLFMRIQLFRMGPRSVVRVPGKIKSQIASGNSGDLSREADVVIKPEEQNCNNQTKVSIDTLVWSVANVPAKKQSR